MTHPLRITRVAGVFLAAAVALPASSLAQGHGDGGNSVPARVKQRVHRVELSLNKALDAIDDGDEARAVAKLSAVNKHLGRALKAANRRADGEKGPASLGAVARAADKVATSTADALDGAGADLSDALVSSMDTALDDRVAIVTTIGGLEDQSDYDRTLNRISSDSADEAEAFEEGVADDELTESAKAAETAAIAQATATGAAAEALAEGLDESAEEEESVEEGERGERGDCPPGGGRGGRGPQSQRSPSRGA